MLPASPSIDDPEVDRRRTRTSQRPPQALPPEGGTTSGRAGEARPTGRVRATGSGRMPLLLGLGLLLVVRRLGGLERAEDGAAGAVPDAEDPVLAAGDDDLLVLR